LLYLKSIFHSFLKSLYSIFSLRHLYPRLIILFLLFSLSLALLASVSLAATITLVWNSNSEPDLEGYVVYRNAGSPGPPYEYSDTLPEDELDDPLNPEVTLTALKDDSKYYIAVTAYDTSGNEGDFSSEVCVQVTEGSAGVCSESLSPGSGSNSSSGSGGGGCFISSIMGGGPQNSKAIGLNNSGYRELLTIFFLFLFLICSTNMARRHRSLRQGCSSNRLVPCPQFLEPLTKSSVLSTQNYMLKFLIIHLQRALFLANKSGNILTKWCEFSDNSLLEQIKPSRHFRCGDFF
jgi:hypothetical protein